MSCAADGFQVDAVGGAAGDASHQAVGVQSVALGVSARRGQARHVGVCAATGRPGHVGHRLGDLAHVDGRGAARSSSGNKKKKKRENKEGNLKCTHMSSKANIHRST